MDRTALRLYFELAKRQFQRQLAFRTANLAGLVTNAFFGYIRATVFIVAFRSQGTIAGYSAADAVTYAWVTQALIMVVHLWGWYEVERTIRTGDVVSDLSKPFSYLGFWLAKDAGRAAYFVLFRGLPVLALGQVMFGLRWPSSPLVWVAFAASLTLAVVVSFAWRFLLNLTAFWTTDARGINQLAAAVVLFLSGFVMPIRLFPDWLRGAVLALPFAGMTQIPCDVFLERLDGADLAGALGLQAFWAVAFLLAAQVVVVLATRRVVTQGG
ncbi:MAG: ABC-2 family transporter protein [Chloroflexi bacterium]|nr:ABC-2 family transporter protein [Chloroflexota bacterium]